MINRMPTRATCSNTAARSRPACSTESISARISSMGDTRVDTDVVLPVEDFGGLDGTYVRCHLHRWRDTTSAPDPTTGGQLRGSWSADLGGRSRVGSRGEAERPHRLVDHGLAGRQLGGVG